MRHKHRFVVELTTSRPMTEQCARQALQRLLDRLDLDVQPIWSHDDSTYADKLVVKQFSRVTARRRS